MRRAPGKTKMNINCFLDFMMLNFKVPPPVYEDRSSSERPFGRWQNLLSFHLVWQNSIDASA